MVQVLSHGDPTVPLKPAPERGRRSNETEQLIIRAATELFRQKGYNGTSIADLGQAVGLTTAALYYYVSSKQELLARVLTDGMNGFLSRLEEIAVAPLDVREKLRLALENHLNFIFERPDAVAVFLRERRFLESAYAEQYRLRADRYDALFGGIVEEGMASGVFQPADPRVTTLAILGMINWVIEWYRPGGRLTRTQITRVMLDLVLNRLLGAVPVAVSPPAGGDTATASRAIAGTGRRRAVRRAQAVGNAVGPVA